jgi:hypothetical protein
VTASALIVLACNLATAIAMVLSMRHLHRARAAHGRLHQLLEQYGRRHQGEELFSRDEEARIRQLVRQESVAQ